jgi:phage protein D
MKNSSGCVNTCQSDTVFDRPQCTYDCETRAKDLMHIVWGLVASGLNAKDHQYYERLCGMVNIDVNRKYHNFMAPKAQVLIDHKDLFLNHKILPTSISVEEGVSAQFTMDNASTWINSALFKVGLALEIKMGYAEVMEPVFGGEISAVKTIFSSNGPPKIVVLGKEKPAKEPAAVDTVISLTYGATLNSFTSTTDEATQGCIFCAGECVGLPDIKPGVTITAAGLSGQFNQSYRVEKAIHTFDGIQGFRTQFEAKTLEFTKSVDLGSRSILMKRVN